MLYFKHCTILLCVMISNISLALVENPVKQKLNILILYESLCPDSKQFMQNQLGPNYESLKDFIDIKLVPFGKSNSFDNGLQFFCQHGPTECMGNRQQSCVLHQSHDPLAQVKFAVCQMNKLDTSSIKECSELAGLSSDINQCMNSETGTLLQLEAERITHSYAPSFIPTVIYNGVFEQQLQDNSLRDFRGTVCYLLQKRGDISFLDEVC
ncbi:GILT-like protein 1 [Glossina fuscipes]|uniref:GILT-like protein 1 n=1 Tax=Glossina fuscipes TaxID=7396 RepID=A0A9C5ZM82_9MUSC|nr:GILT-like protein 1 [Glossina fuscipes]